MRRRFAQALICLAVAGCASAPPDRDVRVKLIAFNDFHGNLESPDITIRAPDGDRDVDVPAGGAARFATVVRQLRASNPNHAVLSAGDMIGASPLVSALFLDEPTIEAMNLIGVDFNSVGNHEFDRGVDELRRKQSGGCERRVASMEPCRAGHRFEGARFQYLAANVIDRKTGQPVFPAYGIKTFEGVRVGFIGLTLKGTDQIVDPTGIVDVRFDDEATTINARAAELDAQGVHAIVVLIHQGGDTRGRLNDPACPGLTGDILPILDRLDARIDVVASAHTHKAYVCTYRHLLVTSAASYGRLVTDIDVVLDRRSGRVVGKSAVNRIVASEAYGSVPTQPAYPPVARDPQVDRFVATYVAAVAPYADRRVGTAPTVLTYKPDPAGQSPLGGVLADSMLQATRAAGAHVALLNPGSMRAPVEPAPDGAVTYGSLFRSQPFGNHLVTMTLTGRQLVDLLEQQWLPTRQLAQMLQVSRDFSYAYDLRRPIGARVLRDSLRIAGAPVVATQDYRVTVNSFMASGGDGFTVLLEGRDAVTGLIDVDAAVAYFRERDPMVLPPPGRVTRLGD